MRKGYLKNEWKEFLKSFKLKTKFIQVIIFDILCIVLSWLSLVVFGKLTQNIMLTLSQLNLQGITDINLIENQAEILASAMNSLFIYLAGLLIVLFIICILTRTLVWNTILNKKITAKYIGKFILLNLIWLLWMIPFMLILMTKNPYWIIGLTVLLGILFVHFTFILYTIFTKEVKIGRSLKLCFKLGIAKIHLFLIPLLFAILTFILISIVLALINKLFASGIVTILLLLMFAAWLRFYCSSVALRIAKKV